MFGMGLSINVKRKKRPCVQIVEGLMLKRVT